MILDYKKTIEVEAGEFKIKREEEIIQQRKEIRIKEENDKIKEDNSFLTELHKERLNRKNLNINK
jgi:hypothetical protein